MSTQENTIAATEATNEANTSAAGTAAEGQDQFQGRGAFIVEMTAAGVAVAATVVTEDGRALAMPAIFPTLGYALSQIDEMRALVVSHFEQASNIGVQVLAQQQAQRAAQNANLAQTEPEPSPQAELLETA